MLPGMAAVKATGEIACNDSRRCMLLSYSAALKAASTGLSVVPPYAARYGSGKGRLRDDLSRSQAAAQQSGSEVILR